MSPNSVVLFNSSFIGSSAGTSVQWQGGRTILALVGTQYGAGVFLQGLAPDNATWIAINAAAYSANQFTEYALSRGNYRMISNQGSSVGINATLITIPPA